MGGASDCFCVARFECDGSRAGSVFLGNIVVLLLEFECHCGMNVSETNVSKRMCSRCMVYVRIEETTSIF